MKEIKKDLHKWEEVLCFLTGKFDVVKTLIFLKMIYKFDAIPIRISAQNHSEIYT